jgi:hypothetical protein
MGRPPSAERRQLMDAKTEVMDEVVWVPMRPGRGADPVEGRVARWQVLPPGASAARACSDISGLRPPAVV